METIVAIDLGKNKSVVCQMDRGSLKTQYRTVRTRPEVFHDLLADLDTPSKATKKTPCGWFRQRSRQIRNGKRLGIV